MKKITLLYFLCLPFLCTAQNIDSAEIKFITEKAKEYFRNTYVEANFKNPYSYGLLKLEVSPIIAARSLAEELQISKLWAIKTDTTLEVSPYQQMKQLLVKQERSFKSGKIKLGVLEETKRLIQQFKGINEIWLRNIDFINNEFENLDDDKKVKIREYHILLHCHGENSYGGKVLGRYRFSLNPNGSLKSEIEEINQLGLPIRKPAYMQ